MTLDKNVADFLISKKLSVISIANENDNPYSALVFYAFETNPLTFYFLTDKRTRKVDGLISGNSHRASLVIGLTDDEWLTFQAKGSISTVATEEEKMMAEAVYYLRYPHAQKLSEDENLIFLKFIPIQWKLTNVGPSVWKIISSED